jgi:hypothetical protein
MKKIIALLSIGFALNSSAQKKDSVQPTMDTVFVFSVQDMQTIANILMESNVNINGKPATGKELNQFVEWMFKHGQIFKKEQPKK